MGDSISTVEILPPAVRPESSAQLVRARFEERMAAPFILKSLSAETRESYRRGIQ